jgi:hypothetical protein
MERKPIGVYKQLLGRLINNKTQMNTQIIREVLVRQPPQNVESEKALLGSIMLQPQLIDKISKGIKPEYFYHTPHRVLCNVRYV